MPVNSPLILIGKLGKPKGLRGQLHAFIQVEFAERLKKFDLFFLSIKNKQLPFTIAELDIDPSGGALILFDEIDSRTKAEEMRGVEIYSPESNLKKSKKINSPDQLIGFMVKDKLLGELGVVEEIFILPVHPMVEINFQNKKILVPLVEAYELDINYKTKIISLLLPDGFLDI